MATDDPPTPVEVVTRVWLTCPRCRYRWEAAHIVKPSYWENVTPETIAGICHCPKCQTAPPMEISGE